MNKLLVDGLTIEIGDHTVDTRVEDLLCTNLVGMIIFNNVEVNVVNVVFVFCFYGEIASLRVMKGSV